MEALVFSRWLNYIEHKPPGSKMVVLTLSKRYTVKKFKEFLKNRQHETVMYSDTKMHIILDGRDVLVSDKLPCTDQVFTIVQMGPDVQNFLKNARFLKGPYVTLKDQYPTDSN